MDKPFYAVRGVARKCAVRPPHPKGVPMTLGDPLSRLGGSRVLITAAMSSGHSAQLIRSIDAALMRLASPQRSRLGSNGLHRLVSGSMRRSPKGARRRPEG